MRGDAGGFELGLSGGLSCLPGAMNLEGRVTDGFSRYRLRLRQCPLLYQEKMPQRCRKDARHWIPKVILRSLETRRVPSSLMSPRFSNSDASLGLAVARSGLTNLTHLPIPSSPQRLPFLPTQTPPKPGTTQPGVHGSGSRPPDRRAAFISKACGMDRHFYPKAGPT